MDLNIDENFELRLISGSASAEEAGNVLKNIILKEEFFFNKKYLSEEIYNRKKYSPDLKTFDLAKQVKNNLLQFYSEKYANVDKIKDLNVDVIILEGNISVYYRDDSTNKLIFGEEIMRRL